MEKPNVFLSLKWKIMSLLGLILVTLTITLITWAYQSQTSNFEKERNVVNMHYLEQFRAMLTEFSLKMTQVSSLVAAIASADNDPYIRSETLSRLSTKNRADITWATLQVDYGLESMRIYDVDNNVVEQWSDSEKISAQELAQVADAMRQESSVTWLDCAEVCHQYAATPVLANGQVTGAVVVSATMADLILSFHRISGADVGFILNDGDASKQNFLSKLGMRVAGLSSAAVNFPLLQHLNSIPLGKEKSNWQRVEVDKRFHELTFMPLHDTQGRMQAMAVVIDDVTAPIVEIRQYAFQRLKVGLVVSLLVMLLMYLLLNTPLKRVTNAVKAIPFIGNRDFDAARANIQIRKKPLLSDEVDRLVEAALQLTNRLQMLEQDASKHQTEILAMLQKISLANEFSERILDTAQVVIITQNIDGAVTSVNHYGAQLLGWNKDDLQDKFLMMASKEPNERGRLQQIYKEIISSEVDHHYHECTMICNHGIEREIAWHHSRMDGDNLQILSVGVDITLRKKSEEKSLYLAEHDQLTGLINRQSFMREVEEKLQGFNEATDNYSLLYMDLDGFKYINDISGHYAGDIVLRMVAEALSQLCGEKDILARMGGDEMAILFADCDMDQATAMAEKINRLLTEIRYPGLVGEHHVSSSIGIVKVTAGNRDVRRLLANADIAMYQAKSLGKSRWYVFSEGEGLQQKLEQRVLWEDKIKQALRDNLLVMQYQPILDIHRQTVSHYEALIRMRGDDGGLVAPAEFIEVAEKSGLINDIDHFVVRTVIKRWAELMSEGKACKVAINLSGLSMNDESLLAMLQDLFFEYPDLPPQIIFEITETAAVSDFSVARSFIDTVRAMGCAFSLDDFGVGFSSFYYLKHLPVDYVKIDGSFIRTLADSTDDQIFVRALTEVARGFGKRTVAEFVGDERSLVLLRSYGVDYAQGYHIGKPGDEIL